MALTDEAKKIFIKRFKSFVWRAGAMAVVSLIDFTVQNLGLFIMPGSLTIFLGLGLGELSKFLNSNIKDLSDANNSR